MICDSTTEPFHFTAALAETESKTRAGSLHSGQLGGNICFTSANVCFGSREGETRTKWRKEPAGGTRGKITFPPAWGFAANPASPKLFHSVCISKRFPLCRITAPTSSNTHWSLKMKENEFLGRCNFDGAHCASAYCKEASFFIVVVVSGSWTPPGPSLPHPLPSEMGERGGGKTKICALR